MALSKHMQKPEPKQQPLEPIPAPTPDDQLESILKEFTLGREHLQDPRPDLRQDSELWTCLLLEASHDKRLCLDLTAIRKMGTRIIKVSDGLKLVPVIDPLNDIGWADMDDYKEAVNECLRPKAGQLTGLLERASHLKNTLQQTSSIT